MLALALILVPETRPGAAVIAGVVWLLVQFALLARTRSVSVAAFGWCCAAGALLAVPTGLVEVTVADLAGVPAGGERGHDVRGRSG